MRITNNHIQNFSLLIVSTLVSLMLAECSLRMLYPMHPTLYQPDSTLLFKLIPGTKKIYRHSAPNGGERVSVKINSAGFRGEEMSPRSTKKRVVIYGDSYIQGDFSSLEKTFAEQLEHKLSVELGEELEVINAGVAGYGPDQVSLKMEQELERLEAELVIVSVFADNDYGDLVRNKIYRLNGHGEIVNNQYRLSDALVKEMNDAEQPEGGSGSYIVSMLRPLAVKGDDPASNDLLPVRMAKRTYWIIHELLMPESIPVDTSWVSGDLQLSIKEYEELVEHGDNEVNNILRDHYDADIAVEPSSMSSLYKVKLMEQVLGRISRIAAEHHTPLLLIIVPSPIDVCHDYDRQVDRGTFPDYDPARLTGHLEIAAGKQDIDFINLYPPLRQRKDTDTLFYRHGNVHWNDKGQAVAAELVAQEIVGRGYFHHSSP